MATRLSSQAARIIHASYDGYCKEFSAITRRAKERFETSDWQGRHSDALQRFDLYERSLAALAEELRTLLGSRLDRSTEWHQIKRSYAHLISKRPDSGLAETYYNSVTRKLLWTVGIDRKIEFFHRDNHVPTSAFDPGIIATYRWEQSTVLTIRRILTDVGFAVPFEDLARDEALIANEIDLRVWPLSHHQSIDRIELVAAPFFRNKVAYLVGRIYAGGNVVPMVLPLYNGKHGLYVDTVLLSESEASRVFSFAFSYFQVDLGSPETVIAFLRSILPHKPVAELYISVGLNKHGKTVLYRDLHRFVHVSKEKFVIAPGKEGAVMIAFTLPDYEFVLKIIKDHPCFLRTGDVTTKQTTREEIMRQYDFVCHRDRVGRMVDTQEFENLRFKVRRFSSALLGEFANAAREIITFDGEYVVIRHLYIQRRVTPMPMYLMQETDPEALRKVIIDFGYFLKDLAAVGIFPYDLFNMWNYGVTRRGRVVLFDYDDVQPLEKARFRQKPEPRDEIEEMQPEEDRISVSADDFFIDEADRFSGIPVPLKGVFKAVHGDLYTLDFWKDMKRRVRRGEQFDITPYDPNKKFSHLRGLV